MKCIIVDDEFSAREILTLMIAKYANLELVKTFSSAIDAILFFNNGNEVDLIFLDLHMPHLSGFDFIKTLKNAPKIIMTTTDSLSAVHAFDFDCIIDYLQKPFEPARFELAIERVQKRIDKGVKTVTKVESGTAREIYFNINRKLVAIDHKTINYIKANGDYFNVFTDTKRYTVHSTLSKIEAKLTELNFLRIHRSYIINLKKIVDIQDSTVLIGDIIIPISSLKRKQLINSLCLIN